ncbi:MAG: hypothetical protein EXR62_18360 [Chloroflexi bacterium]|nr:hypothetical protein [Chloroflexota bacterium]
MHLANNPPQFIVDGKLAEYQLARITARVAFGHIDANGEFTIYGQGKMTVGLKKGSIGCFLATRRGGRFACVPPHSITLADIGIDAGKFRHKGNKVWGARAFISVSGYGAYVFAEISPDQRVAVGTNLDSYKAIQPTTSAAATSPGGAADVALSGYTHYTTTVPSSFPAVPQLYIAEGITDSNKSALLDLRLTGPGNQPVTPTLVYTDVANSLRVWSVAAPQAGTR